MSGSTRQTSLNQEEPYRIRYCNPVSCIKGLASKVMNLGTNITIGLSYSFIAKQISKQQLRLLKW